MGKRQEKKAPAAPDKFFVLGFDNKGKPRGARFAEYNERVLNFVSDLMLTSVYPASAAFTEAAMKLPPGRAYASGKEGAKDFEDVLLSPEQTTTGLTDVHSSSDQTSPFENTAYSTW